MMYDLIGDIHGHAAHLEALLEKMDYNKIAGVWQHHKRKAVFIGDYIDRGPAIRETLQIVRGMVHSGHAIALMGNHEYNALAYAYQLPDGSFLREHNEKNTTQHTASLEQFRGHEEEWRSSLGWFYTLPLFLELPGLRAVHACWDEKNIKWLKERGYATMSYELLQSAHQRDNQAYKVINELLKGKEMSVSKEFAWADKDGHLRTENRIKWWVNDLCTYDDFLFDCPDKLKEQVIIDYSQKSDYPKDERPIFIGHYWLKDLEPTILAANGVCLDYSIAKDGNLVAYSWKGEKVLSNNNFVYVSIRK